MNGIFFVWLELCVTLIFTGEYLLRLFSWPAPAKYVFSFWGFIDLVTILPLYVHGGCGRKLA
ncbi:membrane transport protein [Salmonella enterica subsp. enterica]|uniref:Membrane transport protein n=1 Tax=Salmonella enterica I TaxID=59201 RepID=A0A447N9G6_SALET|nr:membrane transport protein [Salmonella enterica subsp. enterica]